MSWLNRRTVGWAFGLVLLAAGGASVAVLAMGAGPARKAPPTQGAGDSRPGAAASQRARVKVVRPARQRLQRVTTQPAHVEPFEKVAIQAKVSGYLQALGQVSGTGGKTRDLDLGDRVSRGQVLAELWVPEMEQEKRQKEVLVEQAQADLHQADAALKAAKAMVSAAKAKLVQAQADVSRFEADVDYRKSEYERYRRLLAERTVQRELVDERYKQYRAADSALAGAKAAVVSAQANIGVEQAKEAKAAADVESAKAHLRVARSNLRQAQILYDYRSVRAPFPGVITRRLIDTGAFVQSAAAGRPTPLFLLARVDRMRIVADIPEPDTPWVKVGQPANFRLDAARGRSFPGKVVRLADALDSSTRTMRVEVEPDKGTDLLRPGLYGSVTITLADFPDALLLPTSALVASEDKPSVMVVRDGRARRQRVQLGINDGVRMQVTGGLNGDEQVITDGKDAVRDGEPVEVVR